MSEAAATPTRNDLLVRGLRLEALTISWNVIEAFVAIGAGWLAGSVALVGFGLDSSIETIAAVALYVRLRAELRGASEEETEAHEKRALRVVGVTFFALALYIVYEAGSTLWLREPPEPSRIGIGLATVSLVVMPFLAWAKHRTGEALGSRALIADAKETICLHLPLFHASSWPGSQRSLWALVGRPRCRAPDAALGGERGARGPRR